MHTGPVLDVCWSDDGSKVFTASCDKTAKMWDLNSNQAIQIAQHDAPVKTVHWIKAPNYSCVMTGSWDKTLKFWDTRSSNPMMVLQLPERCYCADVIYPMAVVATAERGLIVYQLENQPSEFRRIESPLKHQHRCVAIFKDKQNKPTGFALGSIEGRVAIHYINPQILPRITSPLNVIDLTGPTLLLLRTSMRLMELRSILSMAPLPLWDLMVDSAFGTRMPEQN